MADVGAETGVANAALNNEHDEAHDPGNRAEKCKSYVDMIKHREDASMNAGNGDVDAEHGRFLSDPHNQSYNFQHIGAVDGKYGDDVDRRRTTLEYTWSDVCMVFYAMLTLVADMASDLFVAYIFWHHGRHQYFIATLVFIAVPAVMLTATGLRWYLIDNENPNVPRASMAQWGLRIFFLLIQMGPVLRYIDSLRLGLKFRRLKKKHGCTITWNDLSKTDPEIDHPCIATYRLMLKEDSDATFLRLFEAYLETGPQLMLQAYILLHNVFSGEINEYTVVAQIISVCLSVLSLAWAPVSYNRTVRFSFPGKANMGWGSTIVSVMWQLCFLTSRCLALSLFAAMFNEWVFVPLCVHIFLMIVWAYYLETELCQTKWEEGLVILMLSLAYTFSFFNPKDEPTRMKYLFFYCVCFIEDSILIFIWFSYAYDDPKISDWLKYCSVSGVYLAFAFSLLFMFLYYSSCHPTGNIRPLFGSDKARNGKVHPDEVLDKRNAKYVQNGEDVVGRESEL